MSRPIVKKITVRTYRLGYKCIGLRNLLKIKIVPSSTSQFILLKGLHFVKWGTGIRRLMRGMATLPQGNQELLVVKDKVGRPQVSLG